MQVAAVPGRIERRGGGAGSNPLMQAPETAVHDVAPGTERVRRSLPARLSLYLSAFVVLLVVLGLGGPLVILVLVPIGLDWLLGWRRRSSQRADLRARRRRQLERAVAEGAPSAAPTKPHRSPDPNEAERALFARRVPRLFMSLWGRGRV